jgi:hypothetical protein
LPAFAYYLTDRPVENWAWVYGGIGFGTYFFLVMLAPVFFHLRLGPRTVTIRRGVSNREFLWADIIPDGFFPMDRTVYGIPFLRLVGFHVRAKSAEFSVYRRFKDAAGGAHVSFPPVFGPSRPTLVALLNDWRNEHGTGKGSAATTG